MRLRVVTCPQCGNHVQLRRGTQDAFCTQCGAKVTFLDALRAEKALVAQFPNKTPVQIGMKGHFKNTEYEVTGRLVVGEQEEDEGQLETYYWDEFELISADGDCIFLEFDDGEWKLMETFVPTDPIGPDQINSLRPGSSVVTNGTRYTVTQVNRSTLYCVEGELTYAAVAGQTSSYMDAKWGNTLLCVEWKEEEIEYYKGTHLSRMDVYHAFALTHEVEKIHHGNRRARSSAAFAGLCILMAVIAFITYSVTYDNGRTIYTQSTAIDQVSAEGQRFGPVHLDPGKKYRIVMNSLMSRASAWAAGVLEQADGTELISDEYDFWDETGTDEDGPWHESDLTTHKDFSVDKADDYYIRLWVEKDPPTGNVQGTFSNVGFEVREGIFVARYLLVYGVFALILGFVFLFIAGASAVAAGSS